MRLGDALRPVGLHLVIDATVDIAFALERWHLPSEAVDARDHDALGRRPRGAGLEST